MHRTLPFLAILVAACGPGEAEVTAFERATDELERTSQTVLQPVNVAGCGDVVVYAYNDADTRTVLITVHDDLAWDAANAGTPTSGSYTLPHPDVTVRAMWGTNITYEFCNDALDPANMPVIDGEAHGISGTVHVTVDPTGDPVEPWYFGGFADVELEDVTFEHAPTGAQRTIGAAILEDVFVGWLPG